MPTARINGIDIWYNFDEAADQRPVMALTHGFAGPNGGWPPVVEELRPHLRLLLYDVRAHGQTTVPDPETVTIPQMAADLAGLLDHLGLERPHIAGVSMGGMISAQFACDFPDRIKSLWLCDTVAGNAATAPDGSANDDALQGKAAQVERDIIPIFERTAHIVEKYGLRGLIERENRYRRDGDKYAAKSFFSLEEQDERNWARLERMTDAGFLAANRAIRERPDLTSRTPSIAVPVLVSCGEWDMFYPFAQRDHRLIASSRFATVRGAAHDTTNYTPQLWKRAILDFIADVEAGRDVRGEVEYA